MELWGLDSCGLEDGVAEGRCATGKKDIDSSVQSMMRTLGIVEDVVCVEEWVGEGIGELAFDGVGGERRVLKDAEMGVVMRVERGILVYVKPL